MDWLFTDICMTGSHGLSYTTFSFDNLKVSTSSSHNSSVQVSITVDVKNTGSVVGSEVVQVYITIPDNHLATPERQLRGFAKVKNLEPGTSSTVTIALDKYAVSYWDERRNAWKANAGKYEVFVGQSSENTLLAGSFELHDSFEWTGL